MSNTTSHFLYTWLLAHAIHPIIWMIAGVMMRGGFDAERASAFIPACMLAMVFSFPAIFLFKLVGNRIFRCSLLPGEKFLMWFIAAPLITMINAALLMLVLTSMILGFPFLYSEVLFWFALPSIVATGLSVTIRWKQFFKLNHDITEAKQTP